MPLQRFRESAVAALAAVGAQRKLALNVRGPGERLRPRPTMRNVMQIQINTDHNIHGYESAAAAVRLTVENALARFSTHITRVEVHLGDETANKRGGDDKRCMMEARVEGHP